MSIIFKNSFHLIFLGLTCLVLSRARGLISRVVIHKICSLIVEISVIVNGFEATSSLVPLLVHSILHHSVQTVVVAAALV